jgi:3-oxoacyl-[acyl-carrier protein] reductase
MSKALAAEVASRNITVNVYRPDHRDRRPGRYLTGRCGCWNHPQQRMGRPEEVASAVVYLASEEAATSPGKPCISTVEWR